MLLNLSNFFTILRILISPFIVLTIMRNDLSASLILFFLAAITDFLDGYTARRLNLHTTLGAYLDPVADKIFLISCFGALAMRTAYIPLWFVIFMVIRELIIVVGTIFIKSVKSDFVVQPTIWGKLNTVFLIIFIFLNLICSHFTFISGNKISAVLWMVTAFAFFSLMHYVKIGINQVLNKL